MAVYFDYQINPLYEEGEYSHVSWHKNFPLLAVALENAGQSTVCFHLDEGELVDGSKIEKDVSASVLQWHPTRKLVACGWKNGDIILWNEHDKEAHEAPLVHKSAITDIQWNGTGSRLITTDENGLLCVWKIDQRGRFQQSPMFQQDVSSPIVQMVFKVTVGADVAADIAAAARAAVSGDESALDMFESQIGGQQRFSMSQAESIQLFFGTKDGSVYFLDDRGKCSKCFQIEGSVEYLLYYERNDIVVTISESLLLTQHGTRQDAAYSELSKVKLSGQASNFTVSWAGPGLIATTCKERVARVLDIDSDQNFVLNLDGNSTFRSGECINCLAYNHKQGILAGGTNSGHVAMWKYNPSKSDDHPWELQPPSEMEGNISQLEWGANCGVLAVNTNTSVTILSQSVMNFHFNDKIAAVQVNPNHLSVQSFPSGHVTDLKTDVHIKGVFCNKSHTAIWNGKKVAVYEVSESKSLVRSAGSFNSDAQKMALHELNVYLIEPEKVTVRTFQGTVKQELTFLEQEGDPVDLNICKDFLAVATTKSSLKIYDLSRREARQISSTKYLEDAVPNFGHIQSIKCNCNGSKVAIISHINNQTVSPILYVWDVESDTIQSFNFATGTGSDSLDDDLAITQQRLTSTIKGYVPKTVFWDSTEPKLFVCETKKMTIEKKNSMFKSESNSRTDNTALVVTMFSTLDFGIIVQDHFFTDKNCSALIGLDIPYHYFVNSANEELQADESKEQVIRKPLRDFVGLEGTDDGVIKAMANFSYLSAIGNMDEAFKAIKAIKSGSVWENMARMCVKTKRLDVALVCLGNMGNAAGAKAVRECQAQEPEINAHVAMLAIQVGLYDEAEELYRACNRYDLLNELYQASNKWQKAIECAETSDRIHLRTTYYNYGKYLESIGDESGAIEHYERSDTNRYEVPRMMFEEGEHEKLENYINKNKDKTLHKWWAQYMESIGEMESALHYYEMSQDYLSMVRVHCFCDNMKRAAEICNDTGDKAASYHLARQCDSNGDIKNAIHYFSRAHAYSNAIRLAKENELDQELMNLALLSTPQDMLDCARYFEGKEGMEDKAVMLYHKGGSASKAIDLAFKTEQFGALQLISEDLDESADPTVLKKCAEFFIEHDQFDKAVNLLVVSGQTEEAIQMCLEHHIPITEDLAEKMSLPKDHPDSKRRVLVLEKLAECAYRQGSYHIATKKFTQAGNKMKAMKSLLKSGDTEKIIFFAGVSRQKEIYVMAANYLQSLDWRADTDIMKHIIGFYTKGRALETLSSFYDACAQIEIQEYQNYDKAFGALTEAYKSLAKAKVKNTKQQEEQLNNIKTRVTIVKKFIQAKKSYQDSPEEAIQSLELLINDPDTEMSIRIGDVYSPVIQHNAAVQNYNKAYELIEDMRNRYPTLKLHHYVNMGMLEKIHKAVGVPLHEAQNGMMDGDDDEEQEVMEEEIVEDDDDDEYI